MAVSSHISPDSVNIRVALYSSTMWQSCSFKRSNGEFPGTPKSIGDKKAIAMNDNPNVIHNALMSVLGFTLFIPQTVGHMD